MKQQEMSEKLIEAQVSISKSLEGINTNLEKLNDANVLHQQSTSLYQQQSVQERNNIIDILKLMTDKYWWLIIALIVALLSLAGYSYIGKIFVGG